MSPSFTFSYPDFTNVERISWYPEALTFAALVKFKDGATVKGSLSGIGFQRLYEAAQAARIPCIELCPYCQDSPAQHRWTLDGDVISICRECAEVEEY